MLAAGYDDAGPTLQPTTLAAAAVFVGGGVGLRAATGSEPLMIVEWSL